MDIKRIILRLAEATDSDVANEYGNDNRMFGNDDSMPIVLMSPEMSDKLHKHGAIERAAESAGIELVHYDEYTVDYETGKAWRTSPDSYFWSPSVVWTDGGEMLTPDHDISEWIDWASNDPTRCLTPNMVKLDELMEMGFTFHPDEDDVNQSGLHQGMDADPAKTYKKLRDSYQYSDVIFWLKETSQFYSTWQVLIRPARTTVSSNSFSHDTQVVDAWSWLRGEMPEDDFDLLVKKFPHMEGVYPTNGIIWTSGEYSWFDTEAMGVDDEYTSWVADELENTGFIMWEDGEPYGILN